MRHPLILYLLFSLFLKFCKLPSPEKPSSSKELNIYKIDSIRLPLTGVTNFLNVSSYNHDILVFAARSGMIHIIDSVGSLKNSFRVADPDTNNIGASLFFGDFLDHNKVMLCSNKGYTEYDYTGEQILNTKIQNPFASVQGHADVIELDHSKWLIHNPTEDITGILQTKKFDLESREFNKVKNLTAFNYSDGFSVDFAPQPLVDSGYDYWRRSWLSLLTAHSVDKQKLKAYTIFNPRSLIHEYDLTDFKESRTFELRPGSFAAFRQMDSVISTYNGNSIYMELVVTEDYLAVLYSLPLDKQNLYTRNPGKYVNAHYIILDKSTGIQLNENALDRTIGLQQFRFLEKNKFVALQNTQLLQDPKSDWLYILEIK